MTLVYPAKFDRLAARIAAVAARRVSAQHLADQFAGGQEILGWKADAEVPLREKKTAVWTTPDERFRIVSRLDDHKSFDPDQTANVYRAIDCDGGRPVVLKEAANVVDEYLIRRESDFLRWLKHPNVVNLIDSNACYLIEEFLPGARLDRLKLSPLEAMVAGFQLVDVMAHAHREGVVIRDLKSENIIVTPEGVVKLFDLGYAKDLRQAKDIGRPGCFFGTPEYAAPELVLRGADAARPASDYYSLGVMFYLAVTGRLPMLRKIQIGGKEGCVSFLENGHALDESCFVDVPPLFHSLLKGMLEVDLERRLAHPDQVQRLMLEGLAKLTAGG